MSLSCECDLDYDSFYDAPKDYSIFTLNRRKRCMSCNTLIEHNAVVAKFGIWRPPKNDIEERIYGEEVMLADKYLCEECSDIYFSLAELGFCVTFEEPMKDLLEEYKENYGPPKRNK